MFTGIITDIGRVRAVDARDRAGGDRRLEIETRLPLAEVAMGASIACAGACLTVIEKGADWFAAEASAETLALTTLGTWEVGSPVNLEPALRLGDELGGHLVSGHVDGLAMLSGRSGEGDSVRLTFSPPAELMPFMAPKGSVTLDGVSLTVNQVSDDGFGVNVIPHTQRRTTLGGLRPGDRVNLEIDLLARYVARLLRKD